MSDRDTEAIRAAAPDRVEGRFEGDAAHMRRSLGPHLRKCTIVRDKASAKVTLGQPYTNAEDRVRRTAEGAIKEDGVKVTAEVLYVFRDIAVTRTVCPYIEGRLHLANFEEYGWRIGNVIWQVTGGEFEPSVSEQMEYWAG